MESMTVNNLSVPIFDERWSSRIFDNTVVTKEEQKSLFSAARSAPSCFNEQPWFFMLPKNDEQKEKFLDLLMPKNREWAQKAGLICFVVAKRQFNHNDNTNRHYAFDCGAAWGFLALASHKLGLSAHAMAGFDDDASYEVLNIDKNKYEVMAAIAVGRPTEDAKKNEERTARKPLSEVFGSSI